MEPVGLALVYCFNVRGLVLANTPDAVEMMPPSRKGCGHDQNILWRSCGDGTVR